MKPEADDPPPTVSVLIGLVSTEDRERIFETLAALESQDIACSYEVLLIDRMRDEISARIAGTYPHVRMIPCPRTMTLPAMRTLGLEQSHGALIVVTEDHCIPPPSWLRGFDDAFRRHPEVLAVGGPISNGATATVFDWANFLCEYLEFLPPLEAGPTSRLPGMNIAYRRTALAVLPNEVLTGGFWESTVHPSLAAQPGRLRCAPAVTVNHRKQFSVRLFLVQRYLYSRYFAGTRLIGRSALRRLGMAAASLALPALLVVRVTRTMRRRRLSWRLAAATLPWLLGFYVIWAVGECVGSLAGPGTALQRIE